MKRSIRINFKDGTYQDLPLSKAVAIKTNKPTINIEQLNDGSYRLIYTEGLIEDFSKVVNLEIVRED